MADQALRHAEYATMPLFDVAHGVALGVAIVSAVPKDGPPDVKTAGVGVRDRTLALQGRWARSREVEQSEDVRVIDTRVDHSWSGLAKTLDATRTLPNSPRAPTAETLYTELFGTGLGFLQLKYPAQWAECKLRIDGIDKKGLAAQITEAAGGPEFLEEIRSAQSAYGEALGIEQPTTKKERVDLAEALGALRDALETYAGEVVTWSRRDAANVSTARAALRPIDDRRAAAAAARGGKEAPPDVSPETPVPEVG